MNRTLSIWIINEYAGNPNYGRAYRHYYMAKELVKRGYRVHIITASFSHLLSRPIEVKKIFSFEETDGINYIFVRVPHYSHAYDKKRVLKWFVFTLRLFKLSSIKIEKPDIIIVSVTEPFPFLAGYYLAKKFRSKLIYEVRDLWPLTLIELGNYSRWHPLIMLMQLCENFAYKKADAVISVLPNAKDYMIQHGMSSEKFHYIPNGISFDTVRDAPLEAFVENSIPNNKFIIGYVGTIGISSALEHLIEAANILREFKEIHFIITGEGANKKTLLDLVNKLNLKNITFTGYIPQSQIQTLIKKFDVCYVGAKRRKLYEYGISFNKLFEYMYAGKPILFAINSNYNLVEEYKCGISIPAEDPKAIAEAILKLYKMPEEERRMLGENGRKCLEKYHSIPVLVDKLEKLIKKCLEDKKVG